MPRRARISSTNLLWSAAVVALAAFGLGFVLSYDPGSSTEQTIPTSSTEPPPTTTTPTTSAPTTAPASTTTTPPTTLPPTTVVPTTPPPTTGVPTTPPPTVATTTTLAAAPGEVVVSYPRDARGNMAIRAGTTAAIVLQNVGGSAISYTINSVGPVTLAGGTSAVGTLAPGETQNQGVTASANQPYGDGPHASVAIFTGAGLVVSIPVAIWSPEE